MQQILECSTLANVIQRLEQLLYKRLIDLYTKSRLVKKNASFVLINEKKLYTWYILNGMALNSPSISFLFICQNWSNLSEWTPCHSCLWSLACISLITLPLCLSPSASFTLDRKYDSTISLLPQWSKSSGKVYFTEKKFHNLMF